MGFHIITLQKTMSTFLVKLELKFKVAQAGSFHWIVERARTLEAPQFHFFDL